jgi:putative spermidine/putrescine transport system permease protein
LAVEAVAASEAGSLRGARLKLSAAFWRRPWLKLAVLLLLPVGAFVAIYAASLGVMLVSSFWSTDAFTGNTIRTWTLDQFRTIFSLSDPTYLRIAGRTIGIAAAVTVTDAVLAFPLAFLMAKVAGRRTRALLFVLVLLPLWSSYLVRIYSWTTILSKTGPLNWALNGLGLPDAQLAYTNKAMWIVFTYVWLPFMILPVYAALERIPSSLLEASGDLGARGFRTFRSVIFPLAFPGVVAGSIFTFSLTLGDYITPLLVGGPSSTFIGNIVYEQSSTNLAFAAAYAMVPVGVMAGYIVVARRLGAFEAL